MSTTHYITAFWRSKASTEAIELGRIEMGERSVSRLEDCNCDLDGLYEGEYLDIGEKLSLEEMLGSMTSIFLRRISPDTCHRAYCHMLAWVKVLMDVYPQEYEANMGGIDYRHPDDVAYANSLHRQLEEKEFHCENFLSTYEEIREDMRKHHPAVDEQVSLCISWSQTVMEFAKSIRDKAMDVNGDIEIEFVAF